MVRPGLFAQKQHPDYFPPRGQWEHRWAAALGLDSVQLDEAIRFARENESKLPRDQELAQAVTMASTNPARVGRVPGRLRALQPGTRADLVRFRMDAGRIEILETWLSGQRVY